MEGFRFGVAESVTKPFRILHTPFFFFLFFPFFSFFSRQPCEYPESNPQKLPSPWLPLSRLKNLTTTSMYVLPLPCTSPGCRASRLTYPCILRLAIEHPKQGMQSQLIFVTSRRSSELIRFFLDHSRARFRLVSYCIVFGAFRLPQTPAVLFAKNCTNPFSSQTSHLILRRLRALGVFAELLPCTTKVAELSWKPKGIIFSGGAKSLDEWFAPRSD